MPPRARSARGGPAVPGSGRAAPRGHSVTAAVTPGALEAQRVFAMKGAHAADAAAGRGYRKEQTSVNVVLCGPYVNVSALPRAVGTFTLHW